MGIQPQETSTPSSGPAAQRQVAEQQEQKSKTEATLPKGEPLAKMRKASQPLRELGDKLLENDAAEAKLLAELKAGKRSVSRLTSTTLSKEEEALVRKALSDSNLPITGKIDVSHGLVPDEGNGNKPKRIIRVIARDPNDGSVLAFAEFSDSQYKIRGDEQLRPRSTVHINPDAQKQIDIRSAFEDIGLKPHVEYYEKLCAANNCELHLNMPGKEFGRLLVNVRDVHYIANPEAAGMKKDDPLVVAGRDTSKTLVKLYKSGPFKHIYLDGMSPERLKANLANLGQMKKLERSIQERLVPIQQQFPKVDTAQEVAALAKQFPQAAELFNRLVEHMTILEDLKDEVAHKASFQAHLTGKTELRAAEDDGLVREALQLAHSIETDTMREALEHPKMKDNFRRREMHFLGEKLPNASGVYYSQFGTGHDFRSEIAEVNRSGKKLPISFIEIIPRAASQLLSRENLHPYKPGKAPLKP